MRRRDFNTLLGGAAAAWPLVAWGQSSRTARVGWVESVFEDDLGGKARVEVFHQSMEKVGWALGRNLVVDYRWGVLDIEKARVAAAELLKLQPDLILCAGTPAAAAFRQATDRVPIVFTSVSEPVAQGIVESLAHPGKNLTGFTYMEPTMGAKWLDFLKQIVPDVTQAALMFNPDSGPYAHFFYESIQTVTAKLAVEVAQAPVHDLNEVEHVITMLQAKGHAGLIVSPEGFTLANRKSIIELVARHRIPAVYGVVGAAYDGALMHYCVDLVDQTRQAVGYVDRILRGDKPANLPVQQPTKFSLVVNLKTARALGVTIPPTLLVAADELIE
jgi:putative tryptophan/tyrosine transport system substrate-binding protein